MRSSAPPFPIRSGMGEHGLAYCLIKNQERKTPWAGGDSTYGVMRWGTIGAIIDYRAHGLPEREVIRMARQFVAEWFESGLSPKAFGNPAVRELVRIADEYPLIGKSRFVEILNWRGYPKEIAAAVISDAVRVGLIRARRGGGGTEYRLEHEPHTRDIADLMERVTAMMPRHPFGIPFAHLRNAAGCIAGGGIFRGAVLIERALNAGVLRVEMRRHWRKRELFFFPNFKTKGK